MSEKTSDRWVATDSGNVQWRDDGGPVFPVTNLDAPPSAWGMSLRDYFAAHAIDDDIEIMMLRIEYVDRVVVVGGKKEIRKGLPHEAREIARYMHADAMLKARSA